VPFRLGHIPTQDELLSSADVTAGDIADARRVSAQRAPQMRPAFEAELIDESEDPGPIPDAG
jgi:hypothetical protein